ncbi:hypothetical protein EVAR_69348_1 [Eumeta japonica]|uniref:Uncharacterized protein n=1 Tax=Eumeta variegata TaxID=151549 RepID=A0A4C2A4T1_EUMVA|nr:hypothetical protein EVAR_69348_1 [Eumeta japonica]
MIKTEIEPLSQRLEKSRTESRALAKIGTDIDIGIKIDSIDARAQPDQYPCATAHHHVVRHRYTFIYNKEFRLANGAISRHVAAPRAAGRGILRTRSIKVAAEAFIYQGASDSRAGADIRLPRENMTCISDYLPTDQRDNATSGSGTG